MSEDTSRVIVAILWLAVIAVAFVWIVAPELVR